MTCPENKRKREQKGDHINHNLPCYLFPPLCFANFSILTLTFILRNYGKTAVRIFSKSVFWNEINPWAFPPPLISPPWYKDIIFWFLMPKCFEIKKANVFLIFQFHPVLTNRRLFYIFLIFLLIIYFIFFFFFNRPHIFCFFICFDAFYSRWVAYVLKFS